LLSILFLALAIPVWSKEISTSYSNRFAGSSKQASKHEEIMSEATGLLNTNEVTMSSNLGDGAKLLDLCQSEEEKPKKIMLILITKMGLRREQVQHQQRAMSMLEAHHIPYETLDGADPANKEAYVLVQLYVDLCLCVCV
jgi:hypothetical protein